MPDARNNYLDAARGLYQALPNSPPPPAPQQWPDAGAAAEFFKNLPQQALPQGGAGNAVSVGPSTSLDALLPTIDFGEVAQRAMHMPGAQFFWAGGVGLAIGLLVCIMKDVVFSDRPNWWAPFVRTAAWAAVLGIYSTATPAIIAFVTALGQGIHSGNTVAEVFAARYNGFSQYAFSHSGAMPFILTPDGFITSTMQLFTHIAYVAVLALVFCLKCGQIFLLSTIVTYGPILLGAAAMGSAFHVLAVAWFWALIEISAWSVTMGIMLHTLDLFTLHNPSTYNSVAEMIVCGLYIFVMCLVPKVTSSLIRSESAGNLGAQMWRMGRDVGTLAWGVAQAKIAAFGGGVRSGVAGGGSRLAGEGAKAAMGKLADAFESSLATGARAGDGQGAASRGGSAAHRAGVGLQRKKAQQNFAIKHNMKKKAERKEV
jgi:hypothetical protein